MAMDQLLAVLQDEPHKFLQPNAALHTNTLDLLKFVLDPLALEISSQQQYRNRSLQSSRKRKRSSHSSKAGHGSALKIRRLAVEGFAVEQIWEQTRRIIDSATEETERGLLKQANKSDDVRNFQSSAVSNRQLDQAEVGGARSKSHSRVGEIYVTSSGEDGDHLAFAPDVENEDSLGFSDEDDVEVMRTRLTTSMGDSPVPSEEEPAAKVTQDRISANQADAPDKFGLNDGFFNIDHFNKISSFLEKQDASGNPDDGRASDEEDLDWDVDPLIAVNRNTHMLEYKHRDKVRRGMNLGSADEQDSPLPSVDGESQPEDDGPVFGNIDLYAPEGASDEDQDSSEEEGHESNIDENFRNITDTSNIRYNDFFAPPSFVQMNNTAKRLSHLENTSAQEQNAVNGDESSAVARTVAQVHRELFSESSEGSDDEDSAKSNDPHTRISRLSKHERQQLALREEIRKLEGELVSKRDWQLSGEVRAVDRPVNALLEEDLDFERAGKPVPVITAEISKDIEEMIKQRIIAKNFDEVLRRRPHDMMASARRGRVDVELDDKKSRRGLADIYESHHLQRTDPNFKDEKDEKLQSAHTEIEVLWKSVSQKLDALTSWHYRPKPAAPQLEVRVDAPALKMEDARPTAGKEVSGASVLAPQEVYRVGDDILAGEVLATDGLPTAREELSREQKRRRRQREKERAKKAGRNEEHHTNKGAPNQQQRKETEAQAVLGTLKRGGVRLIGKKGEVTDVDGRTSRQKEFAQMTGGAFKL